MTMQKMKKKICQTLILRMSGTRQIFLSPKCSRYGYGREVHVGGSRREVEEERKEGRGEVRKEEERSRKLLHEFS